MSSINQKPPVFREDEETTLAMVDKAIGDSLEEGSFDYAFNLISRYRSLNRVTDLGVAKTLHGVNRYWEQVDHEKDEDFFNWSIRATGYASLTVERYLSVWEMLTGNYIPNPYREPIKTHTIRQLFKIYSLVVVPKKSQVNYEFIDQDYEVENEEWLALSEATDEQRVADLVAKVKGKERNKNFMSLKIDKRGDLYVFQNGESYSLGLLNVHDENPVVQRAIRRIKDGSGITQKDEY